MKSDFRIQAEAALSDAGVKPNDTVFIDRGKLADRIKFSHVKPSDEQMSTIEQSVAKRYPDQRTKVSMSASLPMNYYSGLCIKVYHVK